MASIKSGSGNSGVSRRAQQEYHQKEQTLIKKHHREIKRLTEDHRRKVDDLKSQSNKKMDQMRHQSRVNLSERDQAYQENIKEIQSLHRGQLKKLAQDNEKKLETVTRTKDLEFDKMKTISERRVDSLRSKQKGDIDLMKERFNELSNRTRKEQMLEREKIKSRSQKQANKEVDLLNVAHDKKLSAVQKDLSEIKQSKDAEIGRLKKNIVFQKQDLSDRHMDQIRNLQSSHDRSLSERQVSFQDSSDRLQRKFSEAIDEEVVKGSKFRAEFKEKSEHGYREKLRGLERKVEELKLANTAGFQNLKRQYELQKQNLVDEQQKQIKIFEEQKKEALEAYNKTNHKDADKLHREHAELVRKNNLFHMRRIEDLERVHAEKLDTLVKQVEGQELRQARNTEKRVERVRDKANIELKEQSEYFKTAVQEARLGFEEQLTDQRVAHTAEKKEIINRFQEKAQKYEDAQNRKLFSKVAEYEKRIQDLNDKHMKEMRNLAKNQKRIAQQKDRQSHLEKETLKVQYQDKVAQMQDSHKKEIQRVNRVHQEEIQKLAMATRKS